MTRMKKVMFLGYKHLGVLVQEATEKGVLVWYEDKRGVRYPARVAKQLRQQYVDQIANRLDGEEHFLQYCNKYNIPYPTKVIV